MIGMPRQLESEFEGGLRKKAHLSLAPRSFPGDILGVLGGWKGFDPQRILPLFSVNFRLTVRQARHSEHNIVQVGPPVQTRGTYFVSLRLRCAPLRATPSITSHRSGPYSEQRARDQRWWTESRGRKRSGHGFSGEGGTQRTSVVTVLIKERFYCILSGNCV